LIITTCIEKQCTRPLNVKLNKILRVILSENIYIPVTNLYRSLGFLKLDEVYKPQIL